MPTRNARFWDWVNGGWVKITLRPDQELSRDVGGRTDEGNHCTAEVWEHVGDGVKYTRDDSGRDCDGRYETHTVCYCRMENLAAKPSHGDGPEVPAPMWVTMDRGQRDYSAEAAGY